MRDEGMSTLFSFTSIVSCGFFVSVTSSFFLLLLSLLGVLLGLVLGVVVRRGGTGG